MKNKILYLIKNPIILIFLAVLIIYGPFALLMPADTSLRAIITRIGIDAVEQGIELSVVTFVPTPNTNYTENYKLISATGQNLSEAFSKISNYTGKKIALNLSELIVVNEEISNKNLASVLDSLSRNTDMGNGTAVICTNDSAKNFLKTTLKLNSASDLNIEELITYSNDKIFNQKSNIESFYQGFFSHNKISFLGYVELTESDQGLTTSSDSSGGGNASQGSSESSEGGENQNENTTISNEGRVAVYKDGRLNSILSTDELKGLNWLNGKYNQTYLTIYDVSDKTYQNADITFKIQNKNVSINTYFLNNTPVCDVTIKLILDISEVKSKVDEKVLQFELSEMSDDIKNKINYQIKVEFKKVLDIMLEKNLDLINAYDMFMTNHESKFNSYLMSLNDKNDYLQNIIYKIKVIPYVSL